MRRLEPIVEDIQRQEKRKPASGRLPEPAEGNGTVHRALDREDEPPSHHSHDFLKPSYSVLT